MGLLLFLNFLPLLAVDGIAAADTEPLAKGGFYAQLYNSQFESGDEMGN